MIPKLEVASHELLTASHALEQAIPGLTFHPMGAGHSFLKNGLTSTLKEDQRKVVLKWLTKNKWKSSSLNKSANVRQDGKWYVGPGVTNLQGMITTHLFLSDAKDRDIFDLLLVTRQYKY